MFSENIFLTSQVFPESFAYPDGTPLKKAKGLGDIVTSQCLALAYRE